MWADATDQGAVAVHRTGRVLVPVLAAVLAFATSFGAVAVSSGMSPAAAVVMSATTFGGGAQFAAVSVLGTGGSAVAAVLSGALLNTRYLAMGMAAATAYTGPPWRRAASAQLLGDESWAVSRRSEGHDRRLLLTAGATIYITWVGGTAAGAYGLAGHGQIQTWGLDMASPAVFLALLWGQLRDRAARHTSALAIGSALILVPLAPPGLPIAVAAAACLLGART